MATLTYDQLVQVARAGGLPGDADMWAAVAMAESSGRTDVVNSIGCVGLWQINVAIPTGDDVLTGDAVRVSFFLDQRQTNPVTISIR